MRRRSRGKKARARVDVANCGADQNGLAGRMEGGGRRRAQRRGQGDCSETNVVDPAQESERERRETKVAGLSTRKQEKRGACLDTKMMGTQHKKARGRSAKRKRWGPNTIKQERRAPRGSA